MGNPLRLLLPALALAALVAAPVVAQAPPPPERPSGSGDADELPNLLNTAHGAALISRTGELSLDNSALAAIDGDPASIWGPPPKSPLQTLVIALPSRSLVQAVGVRPNGVEGQHRVRFESSVDGTHFDLLAAFDVPSKAETHLVPVAPHDASILRVTFLDTIYVTSLQARGVASAPPVNAPPEGCWSINGVPAKFTTSGAHAAGIVANREGLPFSLDGGTDGRYWRFAWSRGPQYGMVGITVTPDRNHIDGQLWYEEAIPLFAGSAWIGDRADCSGIQAGEDVMASWLARVHRFPLYGLRFDASGRLDAAASAETISAVVRFLSSRHEKIRFVGHEFHHGTPPANRSFAESELKSLQQALAQRGVNLSGVSFIAAGSDRPRQDPVTEAMRALYSSIDLEIDR